MNHSKCLLVLVAMALLVPCAGQDVILKDGVSLGIRSDFISACLKGADEELVHINGMEVQTEHYCACVCDNLLPTINSWDLEKALNENQATEFFLEGQNLAIIVQCLEGNLVIRDDYIFGADDHFDMQKKIGIATCVEAIMDSEDLEGFWTPLLAENYCECAMDKLMTVGYTYKDAKEMYNKNSLIYNEIAVPCLTAVMKGEEDNDTPNVDNTQDVEGNHESSYIPLNDYFGKGYKIKISISEVTKYYLFDTGASDIIIDSDTERELLLNGVLKKENYLNKTQYTLANNQTVKAQKIKVDNVTIGDYTVHNVVIAVIEDGALLCGKSFLDKFRKWEIDKEDKVLILYK